MKFTTYKYQKKALEDTEIFVPEVPFYCFQTGIRRSIRMIPKFIEYESPNNRIGDLYALEITCVYQNLMCKVEKLTLTVSNIQRYINIDSKDNITSIVKLLVGKDYLIRTEEWFNEDLRNVLKKITNE